MKLEQYEKEHIEIMRRLAPECMVLLKSNGDFPLAAPEKVALLRQWRTQDNFWARDKEEKNI